MDGVSQVGSSINAINQILEVANAQTIKLAEKMMKVAVSLSVGAEMGKGQNIDVSG